MLNKIKGGITKYGLKKIIIASVASAIGIVGLTI
jgi:hypothetical protein